MLETTIVKIIFKGSTWVLPLIIAVVLHEIAHGYVACLLGDNTAKKEGRLSLNPIKHIDIAGTIILPLFLLLINAGFMFGWAKAVPVNFANLKNPKKDMIYVAAAGPIINILLALISLLIIKILPVNYNGFSIWVSLNLANMVMINLVLAIFNLVPIPPLDGSKILVGLLPMELARKYFSLEKYGMVIVIGFLFVLPKIGDFIGINLDLFQMIIKKGVGFVLSLI